MSFWKQQENTQLSKDNKLEQNKRENHWSNIGEKIVEVGEEGWHTYIVKSLCEREKLPEGGGMCTSSS
jgi:hypothetical protein